MGLLGAKRPPVAIDIGAASVKAIQAGGTAKAPSVVRSASVEVAHGEGEVFPREAVAEAIREVLRQMRVKEKRAAVAIPGSLAIVRVLHLPAVDQKRLAQVVRMETEQVIPFPIDEVVLGYQATPRPAAADEKGGTDVLVVAVKKDKLNEYIEALADAGIEPERVEVTPIAAANAYLRVAPEEDGAVLLLEMGAASTEITVVRNGRLEFTRSAAVGGNAFTEALQGRLGCSWEEAERAKREKGRVVPTAAPARPAGRPGMPGPPRPAGMPGPPGMPAAGPPRPPGPPPAPVAGPPMPPAGPPPAPPAGPPKPPAAPPEPPLAGPPRPPGPPAAPAAPPPPVAGPPKAPPPPGGPPPAPPKPPAAPPLAGPPKPPAGPPPAPVAGPPMPPVGPPPAPPAGPPKPPAGPPPEPPLAGPPRPPGPPAAPAAPPPPPVAGPPKAPPPPGGPPPAPPKPPAAPPLAGPPKPPAGPPPAPVAGPPMPPAGPPPAPPAGPPKPPAAPPLAGPPKPPTAPPPPPLSTPTPPPAPLAMPPPPAPAAGGLMGVRPPSAPGAPRKPSSLPPLPPSPGTAPPEAVAKGPLSDLPVEKPTGVPRVSSLIPAHPPPFSAGGQRPPAGPPPPSPLQPAPPPPPKRPEGEPPIEGSAAAGPPAAGDDPHVLNAMAERLLAEIRRSLEFYATQEGGGGVARIVVSGGASNLSGLTDLLQARLNLPVARADLFEGAKGGDDLGPEFAAAWGLALGGVAPARVSVNVIPPDIAQRRHARTRRRDAAIAAVLAVALVAELGWMGWALYKERRDYLKKITDRMAAQVEIDGQPLLGADGQPIRYADALAEERKFQDEKRLLEERVQAIEELAANRARWLDVLEELRLVLPENTWVQGGITFAKTGFTLSLASSREGEHRLFEENLGRSRLLTKTSAGLNVTQNQGRWTWTTQLGIRWGGESAGQAGGSEEDGP